ncbi:MAG: magnesium transporter [Gammaproteobacteria bacterium]
MTDTWAAFEALNHRFLVDHPAEAARYIEDLSPEEAAYVMSREPINIVLPVWEALIQDQAARILPNFPDNLQAKLIVELEPARSVSLLMRLDEDDRERYLGKLEQSVAGELRKIMAYPPSTAGQRMDPTIIPFRSTMTVEQALNKLRRHKRKALQEIFLVDEENRLAGRIAVQTLALAEGDQTLGELASPVPVAAVDTDPQDEVVARIEQYRVSQMPVVDYAGRLVGVIRPTELVDALQQEVSVDIQTMVGVSRDERALSKVAFAVTKRLPWLEINLLTAFLAASVVGLFENTIAKYTALAVLLPVVAGQSGNAGAQALAVTMRGLALREIGIRHWRQVTSKEVRTGFLNGVAIALTTAAGVYFWSASSGLALIIALSMVIAMVAAGLAGASIPIMLTRLGHDPAQSSSILLTTVTDVVGFFSFLGIATTLSSLL